MLADPYEQPVWLVSSFFCDVTSIVAAPFRLGFVLLFVCGFHFCFVSFCAQHLAHQVVERSSANGHAMNEEDLAQHTLPYFCMRCSNLWSPENTLFKCDCNRGRPKKTWTISFSAAFPLLSRRQREGSTSLKPVLSGLELANFLKSPLTVSSRIWALHLMLHSLCQAL